MDLSQPPARPPSLRARALPWGVCLAAVLLVACSRSGPPAADDIEIDDPGEFVRVAREMITQNTADPGSWHPTESLKRLPAISPRGLRLWVHPDHVDVIVWDNVASHVGVRVWDAEAARTHADAPTAYPNILWFQYASDLPDSPQNLP